MYLQGSQRLEPDTGCYFLSLSLMSSIHPSYLSSPLLSLSLPPVVENTDALYNIWEVRKTTLEFNNLLVRLVILRKAIILRVMIYHSERIQNRNSKRKRHIRQGSRHARHGIMCIAHITPVTMCVNMHRILPTWEAHPSFVVQSFD